MGRQATREALSRAVADYVPARTVPGEQVPKHLRDTFREVPVPLEEFLIGEKYLGQPPGKSGRHLSDVQWDVMRHMEQVYYPAVYEQLVSVDPAWEPVRYINEAYLEWGKGSGKDHICRLSALRIVYLLLCLGSAQEYFEMPRQDSIHLLNVAASDTQAQRVYFEPIRKVVAASPWFKTRFKGVSDMFQAGVRLPGQKSIKFDDNIEAVSGHSRSATIEGLNLIEYTADEVAAFASETKLTVAGTKPVVTAEDTLEMLETSARTRFPEVFKGAAISYPRYAGDIIERLVLQGRADYEKNGEDSRVYVSGPLATWDVNPLRTRAQFDKHYEKDPEGAAAKYECRPPKAVDRFFRNDYAIYSAFYGDRREDPVEVRYFYGLPGPDIQTEGPPEDERKGWQARFSFAQDLVPHRGALYALHGDMAVTGDRAGVAMAHIRKFDRPPWSEESEEPRPEHRPVVKLDFVTSFEADLTAQPMPREIQLRWYRQLIWALRVRGFYIARVTFDQWQSEDTMQILESKGIEAERESMDKDTAPWENLRDLIYEGRLEAYHRQGTIDELLSLSRVGKKVDHPPTGRKDEADAVAGACMGALVVGGEEAGEWDEAVNPFLTPAPADFSTVSPFGGGPGDVPFGGKSDLPFS